MGNYRTDIEVKFMKALRAIVLVASFVGIGGIPAVSEGHAFPIRSDPRVGWTIAAAPPKVTIWFDGELEPAFSTIAVYNSAKKQVDKSNSHISASDRTVLEVDLPPLPAGTYRVYWKALSTDTHVTEGDFTFAISEKSK